MGADPDEDLVRRIGTGDPVAVRAMVARKLPRLLALATRMLGDPAEAEDVAQETFVRIWRHAAGWRRGQARFDSWIHRVALNLCYDRLRKRREWVTDDLPEQVDEVATAVQRLAPRQREAIVLVYYQEMSNIEAAAVMQISVDALESLLARGRRSLQAMLTGDGSDD